MRDFDQYNSGNLCKFQFWGVDLVQKHLMGMYKLQSTRTRDFGTAAVSETLSATSHLTRLLHKEGKITLTIALASIGKQARNHTRSRSIGLLAKQ